MKKADKLKTHYPDLDGNLIIEHASRLDEHYFNTFEEKEIYAHLKAIQNLNSGAPVEIICEQDAENKAGISCTVIGHDFPAVFSLISGILSSLNFKISSGSIFTYKKDTGNKTSRDLHITRSSRALKSHIKKRIIIDCFNGSLADNFSYVWINELKSRLNEIFLLLEKGDAGSVELAKAKVNEQVSVRISDIEEQHRVFYPVKIEIDNKNKNFTWLKVFSEDTPFFLYTFSTALSLQNISIEGVEIKTVGKQVIDEFRIADSAGNKIENREILDRIKFSVLLTKQFTYFIGNAPDPYTALSRFEILTNDIISLPEKDNWKDMLSDPHLMKDLARLLGASDFIWEDFVRLQYETILPLMRPEGRTDIMMPAETIKSRLDGEIYAAKNRDEQRKILNEFKDREIFRIDLNHILNPGMDIRSLSGHLTVLADCVVNKAFELSYKYLSTIHGEPLTVAGLAAKHCILGLGKFGGRAIGYASDIELLFVYSDSGKTNGEKQIDNSLFFELLVKEVIGFISAKKEGIFDLDLRLRPYGKKGNLACSLDTFCKYYGPGGEAHSYEKLALVRMRPVGGDREFGEQLKRLRNEFIYFTKNIDIDELNELRAKQFAEKSETGKINAKFSQGALVDIEYAVQILQVTYGKDFPELRTSKIHDALSSLAQLNILKRDECEQITGAYDFFRKLINGLRMLRGSAKDLFLPEIDSIEYAHLARRIGYKRKNDLTAAQMLHIEFDTRSAVVRAFIDRHFGKDMLPGEKTGNVADLIISDDIADSLKTKILKIYGFKNPDRAFVNIKKLAGKPGVMETFTGLAILATDILRHKPDPDMALNNWERFISVIPDPADHYSEMLSQPKKLDILLNIFSTSQFLSDTLIQNPGFLEWVITPENLYKSLTRNDIENELKELYKKSDSHGEWLVKIRLLKKREILRIGTRDVCLAIPLENIVNDLSVLAESFIEIAAQKRIYLIINEKKTIKNTKQILQGFSIFAFGKLGGNELNYSSDIDLMLLYSGEIQNGISPDENEIKLFYSDLLEGITADLSSHSKEGYAFRVDLRLRPYGNSGSLVYSYNEAMQYYVKNASVWEIQALLKLRCVAGNVEAGENFLKSLHNILNKRLEGARITESIRKLRETAIREKSKSILANIDVKNGTGGIRDIEFMVQGLQLINIAAYPQLIEGNTLKALDRLTEARILEPITAKTLASDYIFMRRLEHFLQLYEDRQVHSLPRNPELLEAVAKRIMGINTTSEQFLDTLQSYRKRIRDAYDNYLQ